MAEGTIVEKNTHNVRVDDVHEHQYIVHTLRDKSGLLKGIVVWILVFKVMPS